MESEDFKVSVIRPPMVYGKDCPGNMKKLEKLVKVCPILPFGNDQNKRSLVHVDRLLEVTDEIIKNEKIGIFIPKDEIDLSIKKIVEKVAKEQNRKIILLKMPKIIIKLMWKIKPRIVESLYGNLKFGGEKSETTS